MDAPVTMKNENVDIDVTTIAIIVNAVQIHSDFLYTETKSFDCLQKKNEIIKTDQENDSDRKITAFR